jgi:hypothetical protein
MNGCLMHTPMRPLSCCRRPGAGRCRAPPLPPRPQAGRQSGPGGAAAPRSGPRCQGEGAKPAQLSLQVGKSKPDAPARGGPAPQRRQPGVVQALLVAPDTLYIAGVDVGTTNMIVQGKSGLCSMLDITVAMDPARCRPRWRRAAGRARHQGAGRRRHAGPERHRQRRRRRGARGRTGRTPMCAGRCGRCRCRTRKRPAGHRQAAAARRAGAAAGRRAWSTCCRQRAAAGAAGSEDRRSVEDPARTPGSRRHLALRFRQLGRDPAVELHHRHAHASLSASQDRTATA